MKRLRLGLFLGLVLHKVVWELLKGRESEPAERLQPAPGIGSRALKSAKIAALGFLLCQTLFLNLLPIAKRPAVPRVFGALLYLGGLATALSARCQLGPNWSNVEDRRVVSGQSIVTGGIYRFLRHPIYVGDVLLLIGLELALNSWLVVGVAIPLLFVARQAGAEERRLAETVPEYAAYRARTWRFIPFVF